MRQCSIHFESCLLEHSFISDPSKYPLMLCPKMHSTNNEPASLAYISQQMQL